MKCNMQCRYRCRHWKDAAPLKTAFRICSTVCLGSTNKLWLWKLLKQLNPLGTTQKLVSVIDMTNMYGARGSFTLLRPRNPIKLLPQSALDQICMGKWALPSLAFFQIVLVFRFVPDLLKLARTLR